MYRGSVQANWLYGYSDWLKIEKLTHPLAGIEFLILKYLELIYFYMKKVGQDQLITDKHRIVYPYTFKNALNNYIIIIITRFYHE